MDKFEIKIGDITKERVDAIVNAANNPEIDKVIFVCFSKEIYDSYATL